VEAAGFFVQSIYPTEIFRRGELLGRLGALAVTVAWTMALMIGEGGDDGSTVILPLNEREASRFS
jgi:hypothetical protein